MCRERGAFPEHEARSYFQQLILALDYSLSKGATDRCGPLGSSSRTVGSSWFSARHLQVDACLCTCDL